MVPPGGRAGIRPRARAGAASACGSRARRTTAGGADTRLARAPRPAPERGREQWSERSRRLRHGPARRQASLDPAFDPVRQSSLALEVAHLSFEARDGIRTNLSGMRRRGGRLDQVAARQAEVRRRPKQVSVVAVDLRQSARPGREQMHGVAGSQEHLAGEIPELSATASMMAGDSGIHSHSFSDSSTSKCHKTTRSCGRVNSPSRHLR